MVKQGEKHNVPKHHDIKFYVVSDNAKACHRLTKDCDAQHDEDHLIRLSAMGKFRSSFSLLGFSGILQN
jgi:hypothetical protein